LTISIVYANTTGLRDRSTVLKQNYIDLQVLLDQLFYIEATETEKVLTVSDKYAELLKLSENHLSIDLYRVKSTSSDTNFKMDRIEWVKYILLVLWDCLWRLFLVAVPVIGTIYLFFAG